jgi:hypothetical protein
METIARVVGTAIVCITAVFNYLTDVFLTQPLKATIQHLEETDLTTLSGGESHSYGNVFAVSVFGSLFFKLYFIYF